MEDCMTDDADIRIDPIEAKAKVDRGEALILDVVAPDTWIPLTYHEYA